MTGAEVNGNTVMALMIVLIPIVGLIMAITPYLMKKSECFAVTVPESAIHDAYLKGLKRRFTLIISLVTFFLVLLGVLFVALSYESGVFLVVIIGTLFLCLVTYALMLYFRQKVRLYKKKQNWVAEQQESVAFVHEGIIPQAISLKWNLLYIPIVLVTLAVGYIGYGDMPEQVPMQIGYDGHISTYADKSPLLIWLPVLIQLFLILTLVFSHWSITRSKRLSSPSAPATSALAYGMFAHAQSIFLLASGLIISAAMIIMPLSFMGLISLMQGGVIVVVSSLVIVIGSIAISVVYGQGGSRVFARMKDSPVLVADDDQYWRLGVFYYNPQDPSLFLLERFGVGWTVNWARPLVWLILVAGFVVTVGFVVVTTMIV